MDLYRASVQRIAKATQAVGKGNGEKMNEDEKKIQKCDAARHTQKNEDARESEKFISVQLFAFSFLLNSFISGRIVFFFFCFTPRNTTCPIGNKCLFADPVISSVLFPFISSVLLYHRRFVCFAFLCWRDLFFFIYSPLTIIRMFVHFLRLPVRFAGFVSHD